MSIRHEIAAGCWSLHNATFVFNGFLIFSTLHLHSACWSYLYPLVLACVSSWNPIIVFGFICCISLPLDLWPSILDYWFLFYDTLCIFCVCGKSSRSRISHFSVIWNVYGLYFSWDACKADFYLSWASVWGGRWSSTEFESLPHIQIPLPWGHPLILYRSRIYNL